MRARARLCAVYMLGPVREVAMPSILSVPASACLCACVFVVSVWFGVEQGTLSAGGQWQCERNVE